MSAPRAADVDSLLDGSNATLGGTAAADERRDSGRRNRRTDRLMDRATRDYATSKPLAKAKRGGDINNLLLFIDDDMRETALAMARIERYLHSTLELLEAPKLTREQVQALATDREVLDHVDMLNETLESLRRRMASLAGRLR